MSRLWQPTKAGRAEPLARVRELGPPKVPTWQDGYTEGLDEGLRLAQAELEADRAAIAAMIGELEALRPPSRDQLSALMAEVIVRLVAQAAGEAAVDRTLLIARAEAAADALVGEAGSIILHVHPDDVALIEHAVPFAVVADPMMAARGSVRAEADSSWAADGIQEAIARIQAELGQ